MGGYDSGYYGYLWSEVYAEDMFTRFRDQGLLTPKLEKVMSMVFWPREGNENRSILSLIFWTTSE